MCLARVRNFEWFDDSFLIDTLCDGNVNHKKVPDPNNHATDQLVQWAQSFHMVEKYEMANGFNYSFVIKLRPDSLWYGPMYPHCAIHPEQAYISKQKTRYSDQWFMVPRVIANDVFNMIIRFRKIGFVSCHLIDGGIKKISISDHTDHFHFENDFHELFIKILHENNVKLKELLLPAILSRDGVSDANSKCARFLWTLPAPQCLRLCTYKDM